MNSEMCEQALAERAGSRNDVLFALRVWRNDGCAGIACWAYGYVFRVRQ